MGLDIYAYSKIRFLKSEFSNEEMDADGVVYAYLQSFLPERTDGLREGLYAVDGDEYSFDAGSYNGYGDWREALARFAGYPQGDDPEHLHSSACWGDNGLTGPFSEMIRPHARDNCKKAKGQRTGGPPPIPAMANAPSHRSRLCFGPQLGA